MNIKHFTPSPETAHAASNAAASAGMATEGLLGAFLAGLSDDERAAVFRRMAHERLRLAVLCEVDSLGGPATLSVYLSGEDDSMELLGRLFNRPDHPGQTLN